MKKILDTSGNCLLEMPSGTGKSVAILSLIFSYLQTSHESRRLIYLTRTVSETQKIHDEARKVIKCLRDDNAERIPIFCLGVSSRYNLCVHKTVSSLPNAVECDSACRDLTASWVREKARHLPDIETCPYYEGYVNNVSDYFHPGVCSLADSRKVGYENTICPYFLTRNALTKPNINVIVGCYAYLLDPKVAEIIGLLLNYFVWE
jgi:DNA excision repair protein ERCC-2